MSSTNRIYRAARPTGMLLLLNALTALCCSSVVAGSPVVSYDEKPQPNSTVVFQSTAAGDVSQATSENTTMAPEVTEESVASSAASSSSSTSSPSLPPVSSTQPTSPSSVGNASSIIEANVSSVTPALSGVAPGDVTTVSYDTSVDELTYSETNLTKLNGSVEEEFLTSSAADSVFNVTVIAGISALVIFIAVLIGVISFVLYRHFSWNRPQTLSDKFSNDESTGYIDDSAFRENSEEMYSLDNDSFLNSLEAMTIQNYWTDHVKHTKL